MTTCKICLGFSRKTLIIRAGAVVQFKQSGIWAEVTNSKSLEKECSREKSTSKGSSSTHPSGEKDMSAVMSDAAKVYQQKGIKVKKRSKPILPSESNVTVLNPPRTITPPPPPPAVEPEEVEPQDLHEKEANF